MNLLRPVQTQFFQGNSVQTYFQGVLPQSQQVGLLYRDSITFLGRKARKNEGLEAFNVEVLHTSEIGALTKLKNGELTDITVVNASLNAWKKRATIIPLKERPTFYLPTADLLKEIQAPGLDL